MKSRYLNDISKDESGAVAIITAVVLVFVLIGIAALAIDIGRATTTKNELQNAADAAALAGAGELGRQYINDLSYNEGIIKSTAKNTAEANNAANETIIVDLDKDQINMGWWSDSTFTKGPNDEENPSDPGPYNAVQVKFSKDDISTFFARIFGFDSLRSQASATAALTPLGELDEGEGLLPFGVSICAYPTDGAIGQDIRLYPTGDDSCAGWHAFDKPTSSTPNLRSILGGNYGDSDNFNYDDVAYNEYDDYKSPKIIAGITELNFDGGTVSAALFSDNHANFWDLFLSNSETITEDEAGEDEYGTVWKEGDLRWITSLVIYHEEDCSKCSNISGMTKIVGFATIHIRGPIDDKPWETKEKDIIGTIISEIKDQRGGGAGDYGTLGSIPNLVE